MKQPPSPVPPGPAPGPAPTPLEAPTEWLVQALDSLAIPLAILTAQAELAYTNLAFQRVLSDTKGPLRIRQGRLQPAAEGAAKAFAASVAAAAAGERRVLKSASEGLDGSLGPLKGAKPAAAPEPESEPQQAPPGPAWLVLTLPEDPSQSLDLYAAQFGLSSVETRVLKGVAEGADTAQVARRFGLKVATVRDHLASIRHKTGHPSQQALLRELARLPPVVLVHAAPASSL
jgi:DNA-binding CsgD family transcriptional regulator